ncbi:MAG: hypothetical protein EZS28_004602 [Streblomastix strix]|uniref:Uncharacterized protein n=1 Tax=Streblomastix strix TaxID=222440 RepID=A0A5J4WXR0_9EUKA|nr:MAG: hypothetical protein EZS28_004602 [Streblomastix strix]
MAQQTNTTPHSSPVQSHASNYFNGITQIADVFPVFISVAQDLWKRAEEELATIAAEAEQLTKQIIDRRDEQTQMNNRYLQERKRFEQEIMRFLSSLPNGMCQNQLSEVQ